MAQLAVIPGSATAWPGERESGTAAAGVGEAAAPWGRLHSIPLQGRQGTHNGKGRLGKAVLVDPRRCESVRPASPFLAGPSLHRGGAEAHSGRGRRGAER